MQWFALMVDFKPFCGLFCSGWRIPPLAQRNAEFGWITRQERAFSA